MKKRLLPITALAFLTMSALVGCGGGDSGGSSGGGSVPPIVVVDVTGVSLNKTTLDLVKGNQETLVATVEPANATDSSVSWKSANTSIATVENGLVKAVDAGSTTITVTTNDGGFKATCTVNVSVNLNSLTITNKADFEGKKVGDASVSLALTSDPVVNMTDMANKGLLHITSSNESVATVSGLGIHFKAGGTTTIKAELFGKSDQFELTLEGKKSNKELYGTDHEGDAVDPFTNEDALKVAKILEAEDPKFPIIDEVYVKGEVESFYHSHLPGSSNKLCSWYLKPATEGGEKFEAYKIVKADDTVWEETDIWVGAVATFKFTKFDAYKGQYECTTGEIVKVEGEPPVPPQNIEANVAKCLEVAAALDENESTYDNYVVEGYIINVTDPYSSQHGNVTFDLGDEKASTETISVYRGKPSEADGPEMIASAKVKVTGKLTKYVSSSGEGDPKLQFAQGAKVELLEKGDKPAEVIKANVAEAMVACSALEDGATSSDKYEVTGYVTSIQEKKEFASYDYWIADSAETAKEESLQIYRGLPSADYEKLAVGTKVIVTGNLKKYVKTGEETTTVTLEMVNTSYVIDGEGGGEEGGGGDTPLSESIVLDFSSFANGSELGDKTLEKMKSAAGSNADQITAASSSKVYEGNGSGGAHENEGKLIKFGTSKVNGELNITFAQQFNKVVINCHDFYAKSESYPTNSNYISVNGGEDKLAPYNATAAGEDMTFVFDEATNVLKIEGKKRIVVFSIEVSFVEAN